MNGIYRVVSSWTSDSSSSNSSLAKLIEAVRLTIHKYTVKQQQDEWMAQEARSQPPRDNNQTFTAQLELGSVCLTKTSLRAREDAPRPVRGIHLRLSCDSPLRLCNQRQVDESNESVVSALSSFRFNTVRVTHSI
ncbi:hypothetical protein SJAG_00535 [Schizosaccharomyces japonicus yFS275]|uniref:Uncharacterized protein n=1 Tax=Schizosaccharomyces japonicus (strain yFS275 / FY16936) TaxID=402676 RepID=B6JVW9_SCHJY|nr:hypothetical protein SJAG_00535 [Schizosaccharomyces japonicus yFS275]EEB05520.1 hypothetical protein SJAG_00535 [Schizosaccharomyces japonicus yFS275]